MLHNNAAVPLEKSQNGGQVLLDLGLVIELLLCTSLLLLTTVVLLLVLLLAAVLLLCTAMLLVRPGTVRRSSTHWVSSLVVWLAVLLLTVVLAGS